MNKIFELPKHRKLNIFYLGYFEKNENNFLKKIPEAERLKDRIQGETQAFFGELGSLLDFFQVI